MNIIHCNCNNVLLQHSLISKYACFFWSIIRSDSLVLWIGMSCKLKKNTYISANIWIAMHVHSKNVICADVINKSWLATRFPLSQFFVVWYIDFVWRKPNHRRQFTGDCVRKFLCQVLWHSIYVCVCRVETASQAQTTEAKLGPRVQRFVGFAHPSSNPPNNLQT